MPDDIITDFRAARSKIGLVPQELTSDVFETVWATRESYLGSMPGFVEFHLLKGPEAEDHTLYSSHTTWVDKAAFAAAKRSVSVAWSWASPGSVLQQVLSPAISDTSRAVLPSRSGRASALTV